ncbi:hypothetical protein ACJMK2_043705 [Sinanodonta woodiana]|uniref:G-protein coupled receptors family 1 profile domain-containing protein n=1 Tax=Sinanodonta woodiana TaxID=1069815 RepID=A0ABD3VXQ9_SINWO
MNITSDSTFFPNVERVPYYNSTSTNTSNFENGTVPSIFLEDTGTPEVTIILLSLLFFVIGVIGISGNMLVIVSVLSNKKMRTSMTNLLITNLALSDLAIMVFGIPEVVMFMRNTGWTLDPSLCKINRYILVSSLYGSVLTLLALSVESNHCVILNPTFSLSFLTIQVYYIRFFLFFPVKLVVNSTRKTCCTAGYGGYTAIRPLYTSTI